MDEQLCPDRDSAVCHRQAAQHTVFYKGLRDEIGQEGEHITFGNETAKLRRIAELNERRDRFRARREQLVEYPAVAHAFGHREWLVDDLCKGKCLAFLQSVPCRCNKMHLLLFFRADLEIRFIDMRIEGENEVGLVFRSILNIFSVPASVMVSRMPG